MQGRRDRGEEEERNRMQQKSGTGSIGLGGHKNLTWPGEENNPSTRNYGKKGAVRPINYWTLTGEGTEEWMEGQDAVLIPLSQKGQCTSQPEERREREREREERERGKEREIERREENMGVKRRGQEGKVRAELGGVKKAEKKGIYIFKEVSLRMKMLSWSECCHLS